MVDDFHDELKKKVFNNFIEEDLNIYLLKSKEYISNWEIYKLINSSYNFWEIIYGIAKDLIR